MVSIAVTVPGLDELAQRIGNPEVRHKVLSNLLNQARLLVQRRAMQSIAHKTGDTRRRVFSTMDDRGLEATVGNASKVGRWLEFGTGIYGPLGRRIYPVGMKGLAFIPTGTYGPSGNQRLTGAPREGRRGYIGGQPQERIVRSSVSGQRPQPWLMPAWEGSQEEIMRMIMTAGEQVGVDMAGRFGGRTVAGPSLAEDDGE